MSQEKTQRAKGKKQGQSINEVKLSDVKRRPRWNFEKKLFAGSLILFTISLAMLLAAVSIAGERTRVPFVGMEIGKPVTSGVSSMTVTNVQHTSGKKPFVAPLEFEYLLLTLTIKNNSEKPFDVLPTTDTYVKTSSGEVSYVTPFALTRPFRSGQVLPGESTTGELSYLVPKNTAYKFYVESGWSGGAVSFMVQSDKHKQDSP
ncbi:DUF4352 domain-containing protein [Candidatus Saccharibacteria bacterium]|nr:MAG: DUF4352 domain-containing protein [Candidatus Saccharibacteria bacterium]